MHNSIVYFHARLRFPDAETITRWYAADLLSQRAFLAETGASDGIDMSDDDLLGAEYTVLRVTTLDDALARLSAIGVAIDGDDVVEWRGTEHNGSPGIWLARDGTLPRTAGAGDLLAFLQGYPEDATIWFGDPDGELDVIFYGWFVDDDAYHEYRLPFVYAGTAAARLGATGTVSFLGETDDDYVALFADFADRAVTLTDMDPQDLIDDLIEKRFRGADMAMLFGSADTV